MKLIYAFLVAVLLTSCVTEKQRARICANCPTHTEVRDSFYREEITFWDTLEIPIQDEALLQALIECEQGRAVLKNVRKKDGKFIKQSATLSDKGVLTVTAQTIDSAAVTYHYLNKHYRDVFIRSKSITKLPYQEPVKKRDWFNDLILFLTIASGIYLLIWLTAMLRNKNKRSGDF
jgi:hypothetical protein